MSPERELWSRVEPIHAIVYFAPPVSGCLADIGLHGFWNGYFAGRAAPLGQVGPAPVTALFFGFVPAMVAKALPKVWGRVTPEAVIERRFRAVAEFLDPLLGEISSSDAARATDALVAAAESVVTDGRALAAGWQSIVPPDDTAARLWWATSVIREHRGDGHVLAATHAGLSGLETTLTHVASGVVRRDVIQPNRGWTDEQWGAGIERLRRRGLLASSGRLTDEGTALRRRIEHETDRLARSALDALSPDLPVVREVLTALGRAIAAGGNLPAGNPMGVPFPA